MSLVLCDKGPKAAMLVEAAGRMSSLRTVIVFDGDTLTQDVVDAGRRANIEVFRFGEILVNTFVFFAVRYSVRDFRSLQCWPLDACLAISYLGAYCLSPCRYRCRLVSSRIICYGIFALGHRCRHRCSVAYPL